jgi:hypothetical protein
MSTEQFELVTPDTLDVTHIFDGEAVVTGGEDGQVWVATFASDIAAEHFVRYCVEFQKTFRGIRRG